MAKASKVRKLTRGKDRMIAGVCSGIAEYSNLDVTLVRLIWVGIAMFTAGMGIIGYLIAAVIMPESDK